MIQFTNIITLITDFGYQDPYVGQVKGTLLKNNISVKIIDICHDIAAHDLFGAALAIQTSYKYFPHGTVHMVIVDPGVGSQRNILAAAVDDHQFIAPDNGVLSLIFNGQQTAEVHRVENASLFPSEISATFHARDIMAPIASALAGGMPLDTVGPTATVDSCMRLALPEAVITPKTIEGQVIQIDRFGNIRTNITCSALNTFQPLHLNGIRLKGHEITSISSTYSDAPAGKLVALIDSAGYLEIAMNKGNAAQHTKCRQADTVLVLMEG
jgi:S-adenosylmethionine hydrolase